MNSFPEGFKNFETRESMRISHRVLKFYGNIRLDNVIIIIIVIIMFTMNVKVDSREDNYGCYGDK